MIRDQGPYSARNTSKGALLEEAAQLVSALSSGLSLDEVRRQALEGILLCQRTRLTRQTIWRRLHYRLFAHATGWVLKDLEEACRSGSHCAEFVSLGKKGRRVKSYRELKVWQEGLELATMIHRIAGLFPKEEVYGLTSQIRRAAVSIPSNIAEGHARDSTREFLKFISIAQGSLAELETQLLLAQRFNYLKEESLSEIMRKADEIGKMLRGLQKALKERLGAGG